MQRFCSVISSHCDHRSHCRSNDSDVLLSPTASSTWWCNQGFGMYASEAGKRKGSTGGACMPRKEMMMRDVIGYEVGS